MCISSDCSLYCRLRQYSFATTTSFVNTAPQLRKTLEKELEIPPSFFERPYLQSNGFAGHDVRLDHDNKVEAYCKRTGSVAEIRSVWLTGYSTLVPLHSQADLRQAHAKEDVYTSCSESPARTWQRYRRCGNPRASKRSARVGVVRDGVHRFLEAI